MVRSKMADWHFDGPTEQGGRPTRRCVLKSMFLGDETSSNLVENEGSGTVATNGNAENEEGEWTA